MRKWKRAVAIGLIGGGLMVPTAASAVSIL